MTWTERLSEEWAWNLDLRFWLLFVPVGVVLSLPLLLLTPPGESPLYVLAGSAALGFSICLPLGLVYGVVGRKVQALKRSIAPEGGEMTESLMVLGRIQSPGVVVMKDDGIVLVPLVGRRQAVSFADIQSVREVSWLNGKKLFRKRGFYLKTSDPRIIGFAVPPSVGLRWAPKLAGATTG